MPLVFTAVIKVQIFYILTLAETSNSCFVVISCLSEYIIYMWGGGGVIWVEGWDVMCGFTSALVEASDSCSGDISTLSGCLSERRNIITADICDILFSSTCIRKN